MKLTTTQEQTYEKIQDHFITWLNRDDHSDYKFHRIDLCPTECRVLQVLPVEFGFEWLEVWSLTIGFGDDGGPSLLTAHVDVREVESKVILIVQHFDTASREIFRLSYVDNQPIWA